MDAFLRAGSFVREIQSPLRRDRPLGSQPLRSVRLAGLHHPRPGGGSGWSGTNNGRFRGGPNKSANGYVLIDFNPHIQSRQIDFAGQLAEAGAGEPVDVVGRVHLVSHVTGSEETGWTVRLHSNLAHVTATGAETGADYKASGSDSETVQAPPGALGTFSFRPEFTLKRPYPCSVKPCHRARPFFLTVDMSFDADRTPSDVNVQVEEPTTDDGTIDDAASRLDVRTPRSAMSDAHGRRYAAGAVLVDAVEAAAARFGVFVVGRFAAPSAAAWTLGRVAAETMTLNPP